MEAQSQQQAQNVPVAPIVDQQDEPMVNNPIQNPVQIQATQVSLPIIEKFTRENFGLWKFEISVMLRARKLMNVVDGTLTREMCEDEDD